VFFVWFGRAWFDQFTDTYAVWPDKKKKGEGKVGVCKGTVIVVIWFVLLSYFPGKRETFMARRPMCDRL